MKKIKDLLLSRREEITYLFFGVLTTVINYGSFWLLHDVLLGERFDLLSNLIAFVAAVTFAYITNKIYVFQSRDWGFVTLRKEIPAFLGARLVSFGFEEAGLFVASYVLLLGRYHYALRLGGREIFTLDGVLIAKLFLNVFVVIMNYFFSKFFIFKQGPDAKQEADTQQSRSSGTDDGKERPGGKP